MVKKILLLLFLIVALLLTGHAQDDQPGHFEGRVVDLYNNPIEYAHVINLNRSFGVVAGINGRFIMPVFPGDTLLITHVSHLTRFMRVDPDTVQKITEVVLLPKIFELSEYVVRPLPRNKAEFRHDFVQIKLPELPEPIDLQMPHINTMVYLGPQNGIGVVIKGPIQALYDQFSKEAKSRRKLESEVAREATKLLVSRKYNPELVSNLTGIYDPITLQAFMEYCSLADSVVLATPQYELCLAILDCFDRFQKQ